MRVAQVQCKGGSKGRGAGDRRGVFDVVDHGAVPKAPKCQEPPTFAVVKHAMRVSACMSSIEHRKTYCAFLGIDYARATKYLSIVDSLERNMSLSHQHVVQEQQQQHMDLSIFFWAMRYMLHMMSSSE